MAQEQIGGEEPQAVTATPEPTGEEPSVEKTPSIDDYLNEDDINVEELEEALTRSGEGSVGPEHPLPEGKTEIKKTPKSEEPKATLEQPKPGEDQAPESTDSKPANNLEGKPELL